MSSSETRETMYGNLVALGLDCSALGGREMFTKPNRKASEMVLHFLLTKLDAAAAAQHFRSCWPITDKRQEQEFRKAVSAQLTTLPLPRLSPSMLMQAQGDRFENLIMHLSTLVIQRLLASTSLRDITDIPTVLSDLKYAALFDVSVDATRCHIVDQRDRFVLQTQASLQLQTFWQDQASALSEQFRQTSREKKELQILLRQLQHDVDTSKRTSDAADLKTMEEVQELWRQFETQHFALGHARDIVDTVVQHRANAHALDANRIPFRVPELLIPKCEHALQQGQMSSPKVNGKLNLATLLRVWSLSLEHLQEKIEGAVSFQDPTHVNMQERTRLYTTKAHAHVSFAQTVSALQHHLQEELNGLDESITRLRRALLPALASVSNLQPSTPKNIYEVPSEHEKSFTQTPYLTQYQLGTVVGTESTPTVIRHLTTRAQKPSLITGQQDSSPAAAKNTTDQSKIPIRMRADTPIQSSPAPSIAAMSAVPSDSHHIHNLSSWAFSPVPTPNSKSAKQSPQLRSAPHDVVSQIVGNMVNDDFGESQNSYKLSLSDIIEKPVSQARLEEIDNSKISLRSHQSRRRLENNYETSQQQDPSAAFDDSSINQSMMGSDLFLDGVKFSPSHGFTQSAPTDPFPLLTSSKGEQFNSLLGVIPDIASPARAPAQLTSPLPNPQTPLSSSRFREARTPHPKTPMSVSFKQQHNASLSSQSDPLFPQIHPENNFKSKDIQSSWGKSSELSANRRLSLGKGASISTAPAVSQLESLQARLARIRGNSKPNTRPQLDEPADESRSDEDLAPVESSPVFAAPKTKQFRLSLGLSERHHPLPVDRVSIENRPLIESSPVFSDTVTDHLVEEDDMTYTKRQLFSPHASSLYEEEQNFPSQNRQRRCASNDWASFSSEDEGAIEQSLVFDEDELKQFKDGELDFAV